MHLAKSNVALLVAAVVLAVPTWLQLRSDAETFTDISRIPLLFDGFSPDNVGNVLLAKPKAEQPPADPQKPDQQPPVAYDQLLLLPSDKGWQLGGTSGDRTGAPVQKDRVERDVFAHLGAIRADREVLVQPDATPEQLAEYGLDEAHAFLIKVTDKTGQVVVADLLVGNEAGKGLSGTEAVRGVFVRKSDSDDVILYEPQQGFWRRDVDEANWLDKVLARIEPDKVRRLSIRNATTSGAPVTFAREAGKASWQAVEPPPGVGAVRQTEVEALLQRFRYLGVQDYRIQLARAGNLAQLGLEPPAIGIDLVVDGEDGEKTLSIAIGNKVDDRNEYYVTSSESPFLMTFPAGVVPPFELDVKQQLFDPATPTAAPTETPPETPTNGQRDGDDDGGDGDAPK